MHYSTFLLDLDHTLFDSDASEAAAFAAALDVVGVPDPENYTAAYRRINTDMWAAVERGEISVQQVRTRRFERLAEQANLDADPLLMADTFVAGLAANGEPYSGALEVIEQLGKRASLALLTNGLSEAQRGRVERLDIARHFDAIIISEEVGTAKPSTDIFDIVFEQLNFPKKESTLIVGDSLTSDIQGGTNYGIDTCWYNPKTKQPGPSDQITHEIRQLDELLRFSAERAP
jgi:YjjG family noncanonical pyrimidine nucleotidase